MKRFVEEISAEVKRLPPNKVCEDDVPAYAKVTEDVKVARYPLIRKNSMRITF